MWPAHKEHLPCQIPLKKSPPCKLIQVLSFWPVWFRGAVDRGLPLAPWMDGSAGCSLEQADRSPRQSPVVNQTGTEGLRGQAGAVLVSSPVKSGSPDSHVHSTEQVSREAGRHASDLRNPQQEQRRIPAPVGCPAERAGDKTNAQ